MEYEKIYFIEKRTVEEIEALNEKQQNLDKIFQDTDSGDYKIEFGKHIAYRFEVIEILGKGSFG